MVAIVGSLSRFDCVARVGPPFSGPDDAEHDGRLWKEAEEVAVEGRFDVDGPGIIFAVLSLLDDKLFSGHSDTVRGNGHHRGSTGAEIQRYTFEVLACDLADLSVVCRLDQGCPWVSWPGGSVWILRPGGIRGMGGCLWL